MDRKYEKKRNERRLCGNMRSLFLFFMLFIDLYLFRLRHDPLDGTRSYRYDRLSSSL